MLIINSTFKIFWIRNVFTNHSLALITNTVDVGASTPLLWASKEQEKLLEFYERISRDRIHASFNPYDQVGWHKICILAYVKILIPLLQQFASRIEELEMSIDNCFLVETTICEYRYHHCKASKDLGIN